MKGGWKKESQGWFVFFLLQSTVSSLTHHFSPTGARDDDSPMTAHWFLDASPISPTLSDGQRKGRTEDQPMTSPSHMARDTRRGAVCLSISTRECRQRAGGSAVSGRWCRKRPPPHVPCPMPKRRVVSPIFTPSPGADSSSPQPARRHRPEITSCRSPGSSLVRLVSANRWGGTLICSRRACP